MHWVDGTTFPVIQHIWPVKCDTDTEIDIQLWDVIAWIQRTFTSLWLKIDINIELWDDTTDQEINEIIAWIEEHVNRLSWGTFYLN